ncbi:MAG: M1 family metallopeptidase [Gemmatimonadales bacterium]|nr:M1 family metallopeptidase [Gemmatimonadales bacterium]
MALRRSLLLLLLVAGPVGAQAPASFSRADTLRGSDGPGRSWWDATFYDLHVRVMPADSTIRGHNAIRYRVLRPPSEMQLDLQAPLVMDSVVQDGVRLRVRAEGHAHFVTLRAPQRAGTEKSVTAYYHGKPVAARNPPWDGGLIWKKDSLDRPFIATANQGIGASIWWPNKDFGADEPDSQRIAITVPDPMVNVSNGRLRSTRANGDGTTTWEWFVTNPINNYGISINAATYAHWSEAYAGERGLLTLDFYPLAIHEDTARVHWQQVRPMMACFERWFGPYPWYEDGFKLVETPHLGMEHQSAVAYGNGFKNGYRGRDQSGTGHGMQWDFITIHESAHEWFANNITAKDNADMWVHESFANYSEGLYTECQQGKEAGAKYVIGTRRGIRNDKPIIPARGVQAQGSGDMYPKGGNMLHTIRQIVGNDERWRTILRGLNKTFWHQTVTGQQVRDYISKEAGVDLEPIFRQYLETTMIPTLVLEQRGNQVAYKWTNVVPGFALTLPVSTSRGSVDTLHEIRPTTEWQLLDGSAASLTVDPDYYVNVERPKTP